MRGCDDMIRVLLHFLALMAFILVSNNLAPDHLDKNLRLIEQKQLRTAAVPVKNNQQAK